MGWFEDQIKERNAADESAVNNAFSGIAEAVTGKSEHVESEKGPDTKIVYVIEQVRFVHVLPYSVHVLLQKRFFIIIESFYDFFSYF